MQSMKSSSVRIPSLSSGAASLQVVHIWSGAVIVTGGDGKHSNSLLILDYSH